MSETYRQTADRVLGMLKRADGKAIGREKITMRRGVKFRDSNAKQKETARVVLPPIDVPASGKAVVKVKLPDHTGALRFMAVATDETAVGSDDAETILRHPATVMLSVPRFALGGDRFTVTAQLTAGFLQVAVP